MRLTGCYIHFTPHFTPQIHIYQLKILVKELYRELVPPFGLRLDTWIQEVSPNSQNSPLTSIKR